MILSAILSRYFQSLMFSGVAISSSPTGKFSLVYDTGRSIHTFFPVELVNFKSLMASVSWLSSPFNVLILMVGMVPSVLNFLANSLLIKVPWLQQYNIACFQLLSGLVAFYLDCYNTHICTTFDFILVAAHAKEPLFFTESLSSPIQFFLLALQPCSPMGCLSLQISQIHLCLQIRVLYSDDIGV